MTDGHDKHAQSGKIAGAFQETMMTQCPQSGLQLFSTITADGRLKLSIETVPVAVPGDDESVPEDRSGIGRYFGFYNAVRPRSRLSCRTPDQIYFNQPLHAAA